MTTLSFRIPPEFALQIKSLAAAQGLSSSDYVRAAVKEKNERLLAQRLVSLSKALSPQSLAISEEFADTLGDGLA